jgi:FAD/FMN-containing dehydrogenase
MSAAGAFKIPTTARPQHAGHAQHVADVSRQIVNRPPGKQLTISKNTSSHTVRGTSYKRDCHPVEVSALNQILEIDVRGLTATVEGQVTMVNLCHATLERGLLPAVVPEYSDFTIAGLINGEGIQSSSHRYGLFSETVFALEAVVADGSVITADPAQHADLFRLMFSAHGTLGVITAATIRLIAAAPYVQSTYTAFTSIDDYLAAFHHALGRTTFVEGVIYGPALYVLVTSDFVEDLHGLPIFHPQATGNPYYYQHVKHLSQSPGKAAEDVIPTVEYLFRSMRGAWWMAECHVGLPALTNSPWGRKQVDRAVENVRAKHGFNTPGLTTEERERCLVTQDMGVKLSRLREGIAYVQQNLAVYPLWNCPVKLNARGRARWGENYLVDIGIYGEPLIPNYQNSRQMRALQQFVDAPSSWGVSYLTPAETRAKGCYDFAAYERAREKYEASAFPHLDDKVIWFDSAQREPGKIFLWRLYRSYGKYWYLKLLGLVAGLAVVIRLVV